ncbi:unnamed protein product [Psylliodes chrysocephalus]|uniref:Uncharacterized protein n=1 Tax=Psylliodes chrysocephalus TaxID=3402493 RepID=A0A9P0CUI4_9CUCU|nr:unnamed protein product [Psylliodes chrysocephala]
MLLRWISSFILIFLLVNFIEIDCKKYASRPSSSFGSRPSSSFGSRPSSSFGSRPSSSFGSRPSPSYNSFGNNRPSHNTFGTSNHGSFGSRPTSRPRTTKYTQRPYQKHYPVTTMPTHRTTRRYYPVTTMPTHRTTRRHYPVTTMPTHRTTTRQPAYNPYYTSKSTLSPFRTTRQPAHNPFFTSSSKPLNNHLQQNGNRYNTTSHLGTTRKPTYNPFVSSTSKPVNNPFQQNGAYRQNGTSHLGTTRQPAHNPFFSTSSRPLNNPLQQNGNRHNSSHFGTTRQPAHNPFFSSTTKQPVHNPIRNNGSNWHSTPRPLGFHNGTGIGSQTQRPNNNLYHTTKMVPLQNQNNGRWNSSRPVTPPSNINNYYRPTPSWNNHNTPTQRYTRPSWNNSAIHGSGSSGIGTHQPIYKPPGQYNRTFVSRPSYITGSHPQTSYPTQHHTTVINNNNYHYHPGSYYHPSTGTSHHVTVINNNNYYNHDHRVIIPSRHYYGYGPPAVGITIVNTDYYSHSISPHYVSTYHYSPIDTGSTALGLYLGYRLGQLSRPSYYYHSTSYVNNEYVPRYDHYTVHHYYHNSQSVPKESPIQPNAIVVCPGDTANLCPAGNMPLCTNNGAVMCVVTAQSTVPCADNIQTNCASSKVTCVGNTSPECRQQNQEASISIPCVSTAKIDAGVEFINNSLIVTNPNDSSTKAFCVTVVALPTQSKNATKDTKTEVKHPTEYSLPYRYTTNDTGVSLLGYYLGYKLQNLLEPSFSFLNYDESYNYIEKFDHYNVFHYDHDATVLPKIVEIKSDQIMPCAGDSGTFCPQNTTSVCLFDGAVICVAEFNSTISNKELQVNYINSNISCLNLKSPACISYQSTNISIQIPCISTAKLFAKSTYRIKSYGTGNNTMFYRTLEPFLNGTTVESLQTPRELCVTILALPGEKVVLKIPKTRKVSGVPNASNALNLPHYNYNVNDTGDNVFGYYLANTFSTLAFPSYYWINADLYRSNGEVQKYDHYSVHYYEHGREIIPSDLELQAAELIGCEGDTGTICPQKTSSLCLSDGSVWCVTDLLLTDPCTKYNNTACVKTEVSCKNNKSPQCKKLKKKEVDLVCMATLTVSGEIMITNSTIYTRNPIITKSYTDIQLVTGSSNSSNKAQHFCVSVVNIPMERQISIGEKLFENSDTVFGQIAAKIFG